MARVGSFQAALLSCFSVAVVAAGAAGGAASAATIRITPSVSIPKGHPRIFLTQADLDALRKRARGLRLAAWVKVYLGWVDNGGTKYDAAGCEDYAFAYLLTGREKYARTALRQAFELGNDDFHEGQRYSRRALVYDWLHGKLSADEKSRLEKPLAAMLGPRTSSHRLKIGSRYHSGWLSAALALAGEGVADKAAADDIAYFVQCYTPLMKRLAETNTDGGSRHYAHVVGREWITTYEMMQAATGGAAFKGFHYHGRQGVYWLYRMIGGYGCLPNAGDGTHATVAAAPPTPLFSHTAMRGPSPASQEMAVRLLDLKGNRPHWEDILWYRDLRRPELSRLPLSRIFRGVGVVITRSGWDMARESTDVAAAFYNGPTLRHTHLNQGHFQIYRGRTALTPDAGFYDIYGGPHCENVFKTTLGHNCVTITGPGGGDGRQTQGVRNPRKYPHNTWARDRGAITAYEADGRFTYVLADATLAYGAAKGGRGGGGGGQPRARSVTRQFIHLRPGIFVIYDRVAAAGPGLKKRFVLQSYDEPAFDGAEEIEQGKRGDGISASTDTGLITSTREDSRLFCRILLPEERTVRKAGGPTYWCYNNGQFYRPKKRSFRNAASAHRAGMPFWRSEISPAKAAAFDEFLVVLEATPNEQAAPSECELKAAPGSLRLSIAGAKADYEITLARSRDGGHIRITEGGRVAVNKDFARTLAVPEGNPVQPK